MGWTHLRACYGFNMRVWIGGVLTTYPARWFFCDPNAKMFPNPHGAEAEPWLKDFEINKEWGDDGTLKKLDRGINPGYRGLCSVGKPQWFIDGHLPADFLEGPDPIVPFCCGHLPPFNPDPRCPIICGACEHGCSKAKYKVTMKELGSGVTVVVFIVTPTPASCVYFEGNSLWQCTLDLSGVNMVCKIQGTGAPLNVFTSDGPIPCCNLPYTQTGGAAPGFILLIEDA
jgi:hypothetical protein